MLKEITSAIPETLVKICLSVFIPISKLTLMAGFAAGAGLYFFFRGFHLFARRLALSHAHASTVQAASPGLVSISGMATGPHTLNAPLTGKRCYLSQTTVWQPSRSNESGPWHKAAEETLSLPFFIEDSTGQLLVEPLGAELDLPKSFSAEYGMELSSPIAHDVPPHVSVFLARHAVPPGPFRIEERSFGPGMPVFVAGTLAENPGIRVRPFSPQTESPQLSNSHLATDVAPVKSATAPEIIRLSSGPGPASTSEMTAQGKIAAALVRAGITKPEAWAAAGVPYPERQAPGVSSNNASTQSVTLDAPPQPAADLALNTSIPDDAATKSDKGSSFDPTPPLILMKGEDNPTFVISCHGQQELAGSLGWRSVGMVLCGAALAALGFYVLFLQWHMR